jgi:hypothetical protein
MNRRCIEQLIRKKSYSLSLLGKLREESKRCTDMQRLVAILNVATGLIISIVESKEIVAFVCDFLVHQFPRIRSLAAEKLYVRLLETDPDLGENHTAVQILLSHNWESDDENLQEIDRDTAIQEVLKAFEIDKMLHLAAAKTE